MGIVEIDENEVETEFEQGGAYINYGCAPISTYDLVNCLVVGGRFEIDGKVGVFLTHESPLDCLKHCDKITDIHNILKSKNAKILKVVLYHHESPSTETYSNGMTTGKIINLIKNMVKSEFEMDVDVRTYMTYDLEFLLGKVTISPTICESSLKVMLTPKELEDAENKKKKWKLKIC